MSDKERPLPKPPNKAFGRKNNFEKEEDQASLISDRMAAAAAEGKLDEFLKQEMPDNEYARNLANMMMGMTGMMPGGMPGMSMNPAPAKQEEQQGRAGEAASAEVPEDVRSAIVGGDVQSLMGLLRREHQKRNPDSPLLQQEERTEATPAQQPASGTQQPSIDKEIIDAMVRIAADNSVSLDWIILRAIKVYVLEYQKTGKL
jgi:hypothetical protein